MTVPPTKESGSNARLIAEQFTQPLPGAFEQYPGTELRRTLGRAYLNLEAERDALREALQRIADQNYEGWGRAPEYAGKIARAALDRPE